MKNPSTAPCDLTHEVTLICFKMLKVKKSLNEQILEVHFVIWREKSRAKIFPEIRVGS